MSSVDPASIPLPLPTRSTAPNGRRGGPIALVGLPGSGKSSVARLLADRLGRRWVDLDERLELVTGQTVTELFAEGEDRFRTLETEVLRGVLAVPTGVVVATGGGVVTNQLNRSVLATRATVVWLDVPVERLLDRLAADQTDRPLLNDGDPAIKLGALAEVRRPLYEQVATHRVDASADPEAVVLAVEQVLAGPVASAS